MLDPACQHGLVFNIVIFITIVLWLSKQYIWHNSRVPQSSTCLSTALAKQPLGPVLRSTLTNTSSTMQLPGLNHDDLDHDHDEDDDQDDH